MALITLPRPEIPASWMPTTNAEDFAPTPPSVRAAALYGEMMPMARTLPI
jgi:hypothetical protein